MTVARLSTRVMTYNLLISGMFALILDIINIIMKIHEKVKIMELQNVIDAWNNQADEYNQWDSLGGDEKAEFAIIFTEKNGKHHNNDDNRKEVTIEES